MAKAYARKRVMRVRRGSLERRARKATARKAVVRRGRVVKWDSAKHPRSPIGQFTNK